MSKEFPMTLKSILKQIESFIVTIQKETGWQTEVKVNEMSLKIGSAPEFGANFGVKREKNQLVFGKWLDQIEPDYIKRIFWTYIIVRESFYFFIKKEFLDEKISSLTAIFLNFIAICYLNNLYATQSLETEIYSIKSRFLHDLKWYSFYNEESFALFDSIINLIISQNISLNLIFNTYNFFINNIYSEDIDFNEILVDFKEYIDIRPLEKAAPIQLNEISSKLIQELIKVGSEMGLSNLSQNMGVDTSILLKQAYQLVRKYKVTWRLEKNWPRFGLHSHYILIRFNKANFEGNFKIVLDTLSKNPYLFELFTGENYEYSYIYTVTHCPLVTAENLSFQLDKLVKEKIIHSFDIKPILQRTYYISTIKTPFDYSLKSFKSLLEGSIEVEKIQVWDSQKYQKEDLYIFSENDKKMLQIISIINSKSILSPRLFLAETEQLNEFLKENEIDFKKVDEAINIINGYLTRALQKNLHSFRLTLSFSKFITDSLLVLKIKLPPSNMNSIELIEKLTLLGWTIVLKSSEEFLIIVLGASFNDDLTKLIIEKIKKTTNASFEFLSIKSYKSNFIAFNELFDFKSKKWLY